MHTPLTYELGKLESVIKALLASSKDATTMLFEFGADLRHTLRSEAEAIKKNLVHEVFNIEDELHLQRYIQFHQQELVRLHDLVEPHHQPSADNLDSNIDVEDRAVTQRTIEELLHFIERHFTRYFNQDAKAPEAYIAITVDALIKAMKEYHEELKNGDVNDRLIVLVLAPLHKFIERMGSGKLTYRDIMYVSEVGKELKRRLIPGNSKLHELIRYTFLYLNYNTIQYFNYYTGYILDQVKTSDNAPEKIEKLSYILKTINQTQVKPGIAYNSVYPPLKEQLVDWISEEIAYQERTFQLTQKLMPSGSLPGDFKIQLDMSLSQLAYMLHIFIDVKVIQNRNLSDVLRFFSRSYQVRQQNISYESFRVRYYNPEESVRKSVRSQLLQLLDYINKT
jgi:hypothetical protein